MGEDKGVMKDGDPLDFIPFQTYFGQSLAQNFFMVANVGQLVKFKRQKESYENKATKLLMLIFYVSYSSLYCNDLKRSLSSPPGKIFRKRWILFSLYFHT